MENNEELKTRMEWFKELPLQKRLQAMEAIRKFSEVQFMRQLHFNCTKHIMLSGAFTFGQTKQGHEYWWKLQRSISNG
jgi:hypothetical protein